MLSHSSREKRLFTHRGGYLKTFPERKALKTIFNGNYLISDRAWYRAVDYAEKKDIQIEPYPIEFYYDDPPTSEQINFTGNQKCFFL